MLERNEGGTFAEETPRGLCQEQMDSDGRFVGAIEAFPHRQYMTAGQFGEKQTESNESACGSLIVHELQPRDVAGAEQRQLPHVSVSREPGNTRVRQLRVKHCRSLISDTCVMRVSQGMATKL